MSVVGAVVAPPGLTPAGHAGLAREEGTDQAGRHLFDGWRVVTRCHLAAEPPGEVVADGADRSELSRDIGDQLAGLGANTIGVGAGSLCHGVQHS